MPERAEAFRRTGIELVDSLWALLPQVDILSVHVPSSAETRHLIDGVSLARMRPGSFLINIGRRGLIEDTALLDALRSGQLAGFASDVDASAGGGEFQRELMRYDNVVVTPYIGAMSEEAQTRIGSRVVRIIDDWFCPTHSSESNRGE